jgi:hypothetical protein
MDQLAQNERHEILEAVQGIARKRGFREMASQAGLSSVGFLCALLINTVITTHTEHHTLSQIRRAIREEVVANTTAATKDLSDLKDNRIAFKEFSTAAITRSLVNPDFLDSESDQDIDLLSQHKEHLVQADDEQWNVGRRTKPPDADEVERYRKHLEHLLKEFTSIAMLVK